MRLSLFVAGCNGLCFVAYLVLAVTGTATVEINSLHMAAIYVTAALGWLLVAGASEDAERRARR